MLELIQTRFENNGTLLRYQYRYTSSIAKYFSGAPLYVDYGSLQVDDVPASLLVIPFLGNILPVAWFAGFDVYVPEVDKVFSHSIELLREEFQRIYPDKITNPGKLHAGKVVTNTVEHTAAMMLFSGGLDAHVTFLRHCPENPFLVNIHGADFKLRDRTPYEVLRAHLEKSVLLKETNKIFIASNARDFYSWRVNKLVDDIDWWGRVQHGLGMLSLLAPLSYIHKVSTIYIASSATPEGTFRWGSSPAIDQRVTWSGTQVVHDAYELDRLAKIRFLVSQTISYPKPIPIKVCYQAGTTTLNCNRCDKCLRTILLMILAGVHPNDFGFHVNESVYERILKRLEKGFENEPSKYVWRIVLAGISNVQIKEDRRSNGNNIYIFNNAELEGQQLRKIADKITAQLDLPNNTPSAARRFLQLLKLRFPGLVALRK